MQYALVNDYQFKTRGATKGKCLGCGNRVIAKYESIKIHHCAHKNLILGDPWAENETEWNRD